MDDKKKGLLRQWKSAQKKEYILDRKQAEQLLEFLESEIEVKGCDHTLRITKSWIANHVPPEQQGKIIGEIEKMGGYCDCEVLMNCYEDYFD